MKSFLILSTLLSTLAFMPAAYADTVKYQVLLNGNSDVPPVATKGSGTAVVEYDTMNKTLSWHIKDQGLTGPVTAAHFHGPASASENAGPVVDISKNVKKGTSKITDAQAADLAAGKWYLNLHTQKYPDGEIRGQVLPAK